MNGPSWIRCEGSREVGSWPCKDRAFCSVCGRYVACSRQGVVSAHVFARPDQVKWWDWLAQAHGFPPYEIPDRIQALRASQPEFP